MINPLNSLNIKENTPQNLKTDTHRQVDFSSGIQNSKCNALNLNSSELEFLSKINLVFKGNFKNKIISKTKSDNCRYEDDRIFGYDVYQGNSGIRNEIRKRIMRRSILCDDKLAVVRLDDSEKLTPQLDISSKYYLLGVPKYSTKKEKHLFVCENLKDMPDMNGVRGKTPLSGRNAVATKFKLQRIKDSGIDTIIDLRSQGECSSKALNLIDRLGMKYINFPIEDKNWDIDKLNKISEFIDAVNCGDFYLGCANGEARTDLAVAINYMFNPDSKAVPEFYFGSANGTRVSIKENLAQILDIVESNREVTKNWGWKSHQEFIDTVSKRFNRIIEMLCG